MAEGRTLGDPETVHYGLVPRTNRGIFSVNELPDLAERIQVALLNVLEERDIQIRGYRVRLPLDLLLVASANPEDYTNRGRIITPLKDRFGAEVRTHYPLELADEIRLLHQEAQTTWLGAGRRRTAFDAPLVPEHLAEIIARFTRLVRESSHVDQRSGVSARFAIAGLETVAASAVRRAAIAGETRPVARVVDLPSVVPASRGKVEFADSGADPDDERELEILEHLLRQATAQTFRARCAGLDLTGLQEHFTGGETVESGELVPAAGPARPARHHPEAGRAARPAGRARGRAVRRAGRRRGRVRPRGPLPDPPAGQGHRRHPHGLRGLTDGPGGAAIGGRGYRYGRWHGGPDPLAPPYDLGNAVDEIGDSVLGGSGVREALRELLRRGTEGRRGLDELRRSVRERLRQARTAGRMDGTLQQVRELLDQALTPSAASCSPTPTTPPGWPRPSSTRCPTTPPARSGR